MSTLTLGTSSHLLIVLIVIVAVDGAGNNDVQSPDGRRSWTIGYGHDWGAHEYFDKKGYIQGFSKEIINAVCAAGGMNCYAVWAPYSSCFNSNPGEHPFGGRGLMDGWYDACTGWYPTVDRIHVFNFGIPYLKTLPAHFYVKAGNSFNPYDLTGMKIGFLRGFYADEKCVARAESSSNTNYVLKKEQIIYQDTPDKMVPLLNDGTIDALFSAVDSQQKHFPGVQEVLGVSIECALGGNSMMTRKDSDFLDGWNRGFQKLRSSGQYARLCDEANQNHATQGTIHCVD